MNLSSLLLSELNNFNGKLKPSRVMLVKNCRVPRRKPKVSKQVPEYRKTWQKDVHVLTANNVNGRCIKVSGLFISK